MLFQILVAIIAVSSASACICRVPAKYEISEGGNIAMKNGQLTSLYCKAAVDTDKNMTSSNCDIFKDGNTYKFKIIRDFNKPTTYLVNLDTGACQLFPLETKLDRCIPDGTKIVDMYFGKPAQSFSAPSYKVIYYGKIPVFISVADVEDQDSCVPLSVTIANEPTTGIQLEVIGYFNYTVGIQDPSVFDIPKSCFQKKLQMEFQPEVNIMQQRFTLF